MAPRSGRSTQRGNDLARIDFSIATPHHFPHRVSGLARPIQCACVLRRRRVDRLAPNLEEALDVPRKVMKKGAQPKENVVELLAAERAQFPCEWARQAVGVA